MKITYRLDEVILEKSDGEKLFISRNDLAFIVKSAIKNQEVEIEVFEKVI